MNTQSTNAERVPAMRAKWALPTPQAPKEPSRISSGTIDERRNALTEIARTGDRYIRPIVIKRKRAFSPLILRSETEQRKKFTWFR